MQLSVGSIDCFLVAVCTVEPSQVLSLKISIVEKYLYVGPICVHKLTSTGVSPSRFVATPVYSAAQAMLPFIPSIVLMPNNLREPVNGVAAGDAYNSVAALRGLYICVALYGGGDWSLAGEARFSINMFYS